MYGEYRCDVIAAGIINACKSIQMDKPVVVRLQGTNVIPAKKLLMVCIQSHILVLYLM
jgi:succinyl-CoA synthetase beta subunit